MRGEFLLRALASSRESITKDPRAQRYQDYLARRRKGAKKAALLKLAFLERQNVGLPQLEPFAIHAAVGEPAVPIGFYADKVDRHWLVYLL